MTEQSSFWIALEAGIATGLTDYGTARGLHPLIWNLRRDVHGTWSLSGHASAGDYSDDEALRSIEAWATELTLEPTSHPVPGTREYAGWDNGLRLEVWAVTDRWRFEVGHG